MKEHERHIKIIQHAEELPSLRPYASGTETVVVSTRQLSRMSKAERLPEFATRAKRREKINEVLGRTSKSL